MEMLIVIAIVVAVLISVAVPVLSSQLERSREAVDLANVRSAYAQVSTEALLGNTGVPVTVKLKQKQAGWQSADPVNIGGIVHSNGDKDTEFFGEVLYKTEFWTRGDMNNNPNFEFDSRCPGSSYITQIEAALKSMDNSLLQQENCTWAFLGAGQEGQEANRYLFWTSLDTSKVGAGEKIPVLIQTGDGRYYVSETTTGVRIKNGGTHNGDTYIAVSDHLNYNQYKAVLKAGKKYFTLEAAYKAYVVALAKDEYKGVREKCS